MNLVAPLSLLSLAFLDPGERPNVAFGALSAPNVAFGASSATNATLGRTGSSRRRVLIGGVR